MTNKTKQQEDYLSRIASGIDDISSELKPIKDAIEKNDRKNDPSDFNKYLIIDLDMLPGGIFYKVGTVIRIRAAGVAEIQAYSVVNNVSHQDVREKMNAMLSSCVKITFPNGTHGSYEDIKLCDRLTIILMIRELTFQKGSSLAKQSKCTHCGESFEVPYRVVASQTQKSTVVNHVLPDDILEFFRTDLRCFEFDFNGEPIRIGPVTIGLEASIMGHIIDINKKTGEIIDDSFAKIIPYTMYDRNKISEDGLRAKLKEYKNMEDIEKFLFLNSAVDELILGIKEIKTECPKCNGEVCTDMIFPNGTSSIFVLPNAFRQHIKK